MLSMTARLKRDKLFEVGDMVTIRTVKDMIKEYGTCPVFPNEPDVLFSFIVGENEMEQYCGKTFKIINKLKEMEES